MYELGYLGDPVKLKNGLSKDFEVTEQTSDRELNHALIRSNGAFNNNKLISELIKLVEIRSVAELIPSMNDVFIHVVQETNKE